MKVSSQAKRLLAAALLTVPFAVTAAHAEEAAVWALKVTPEQQKEAAAAGAADAKRDGAPVALPEKKKIGVMLLSAQSASSDRILVPAKRIAGLLGYEVVVCDPNFDSQKIAQCATSLLAQKPDMIISVSQNPGPLGSALSDAHAADIPWFDVVSGVTPSPNLIPYGSPGIETAHVMDKWLFAEILKRKGAGKKLQVLALTAPTVGLADLVEEQTLAKDAAATPNAEIVIKHDLDLPNIVQDTLTTVTNGAKQYPDLGGTWTVCDLCVPLISQALDSAGLSGDKRPIVAGDYTTARTIALMRQGKVDGVDDLPLEASVWVAFDQALEHWARKKAINASYDVFTTGYSLKFMEPYMVTKENVGADGPIPVFGSDYETFFLTKWKAEFGIKG